MLTEILLCLGSASLVVAGVVLLWFWKHHEEMEVEDADLEGAQKEEEGW